jgi:hypothetical protein
MASTLLNWPRSLATGFPGQTLQNSEPVATFPGPKIVSALLTQLGFCRVVELLPLKKLARRKINLPPSR